MSVQRTVLKTVPFPALSGWESRMVMLEYPPGATAPPHTHPAAGINYIVEGEVISQWEGEEEELYRQGKVFLDHADRLHVKVKNPNMENSLKIVVNYVIQVGSQNVEMR